MSSHSAQDANLLARLERIPLTKTVIGIVALLSFVWLAEAFDVGIVGPVMTTLEKSWGLDDGQAGLLGAASTLGIVLGMIPSGILADRVGRRKVILWGMMSFSVLTMLGALVHGFAGLFAVRVLAGLGEGAVLPMPYTYLSEFVQTKRRALSVGISNGILTAAYMVPNLVSVWALHHFSSDLAWRVPFLMGGLPLLLLIPLYLWLPESPRFLLRQGRGREVEALVWKLENEAGLPHDATVRDDAAAALMRAVRPPNRAALRLLLRNPYLSRSLMVMAQLTGALILFYVLQVFGPTLFVSQGLPADSAITYTGLMMGIAGVGSVCQGWLAERFGRKPVLGTYVALASIGCILFAVSSGAWVTAAAGLLTSFFGLGVFPVSKLVVSEQYPTVLRGEGVYLAEMCARVLSGGVTLYFIPYLVDAHSARWLFLCIGIALAMLAGPFLLWGRETAHMSIEEAGAHVSWAEVRAKA
ncbi:MFS transporter [Alicyclobacillus macrosporangiidus]|uniref:MFS transporter n=1 Tax=Alicyclobacillus macrosporangiidus TaxID=392015 RepID=UPI00049691EC|nr:MFS transporter [Alicyclobacillus macrosporangiidus]